MCSIQSSSEQRPDPKDPSKTVNVNTQQTVDCRSHTCPQSASHVPQSHR